MLGFGDDGFMELMSDLYSGNPDSTGDEVAQKVVDIAVESGHLDGFLGGDENAPAAFQAPAHFTKPVTAGDTVFDADVLGSYDVPGEVLESIDPDDPEQAYDAYTSNQALYGYAGAESDGILLRRPGLLPRARRAAGRDDGRLGDRQAGDDLARGPGRLGRRVDAGLRRRRGRLSDRGQGVPVHHQE
jgi:hypothetical protein